MLKDVLYKAYRRMNRSRIVSTLSFALYSFWLKYCKFNDSAILPESEIQEVFRHDESRSLEQLKIAFICDEMTYTNFSVECNSIYLTPYRWKKQLQRFRPDLFFCESAWEGLKEYNGCWRGKIYRNHRVLFENRKELLEILEYCKEKEIPTVFWNKEDPLFFEDEIYDFIDTALKFDYIYTTCQECIEKYQHRGHKNVDLLMFGVTPQIYNPLGSDRKENKAVFAGSWYADQIERCKDTERVFDMVLENGIELEIYDRNYGNNSFNTTYPERYQKYVKPTVPYKELCDIIKKAEYAITINTIKDSKSMFARRAFEIVMCNTALISNESVGLQETFESGIWFVDREFEKGNSPEIRRKNIEKVLKFHTNKARLEKVCTDTKILEISNQSNIAIIYWMLDDETYRNHREVIGESSILTGRFDGKKVQWNENPDQFKIRYYYCVRDIQSMHSDLDNLVRHFEYLDCSIGIQHADASYAINETSKWDNILICKDELERVIRNERILVYNA